MMYHIHSEWTFEENVHGKLDRFFVFSKKTKFFTMSKMFNRGHNDMFNFP